jgi:SAM-dependent methyltransferase
MGQKIIDQTPEIWGKTFSTKSDTVAWDYDKFAESGEYDAANFIGALFYFETNDILKELCRIVRPKGYIIFSQRDDIMREQHYEEQLRELERAGPLETDLWD